MIAPVLLNVFLVAYAERKSVRARHGLILARGARPRVCYVRHAQSSQNSN